MKPKILICYGTRPEFIKLLPLYLELRRNSKFQILLCSTGQHKDTLSDMYKLFNIYPDFELNVSNKGTSISELVSNILIQFDLLLEEIKPNAVMVHGDTATTFGSSLASFYRKIKVFHVEAGLRTNNIKEPFPEEMNRVLTGQICDLHFCPTKLAKTNLVKEGIDESLIHITGNTIIDSVKIVKDMIKKDSGLKLITDKNKKLFKNEKILNILFTVHRRENWGKNLDNFLSVISEVQEERNDLNITFLTHPNPIVKRMVESYRDKIKNFIVLQHQDYVNFIYLILKSDFIFSDSGGIQEEAIALGKDLYILRDVTERPEVLVSKKIEIIGTSQEQIKEKLQNLTFLSEQNQDNYHPFGEGDASVNIAKILDEYDI